jgi:radical SAM superfamily enzyme YgiQ (UPF0313 family)
MRYEGRLFRPPSEASSLLVQATIGCSHNRCTFCGMYREKSFRIRRTEDILEDLVAARDLRGYDRIFLMDGDALILPVRELEKILAYIRQHIPWCRRVGMYGSPRSIRLKTIDELRRLGKLGLGIIYTGLESGSDMVLERVKKGSTVEEIIAACLKVKRAGIPLSLTVISGLGGKQLWQEHAVQTAAALSRIKPEYIGLLTLMLEEGTELAGEISQGTFQLLPPDEVAMETWLMLRHIDAQGSIFRSNHASNYLSLKGTLNADRERLCSIIQSALEGKVNFKEERFRLL